MRAGLGTVWVALVVVAACGGTSVNGPGRAVAGDDAGGSASGGSPGTGGSKSPSGGGIGATDAGGTGQAAAVGTGGGSPIGGEPPIGGTTGRAGAGPGGDANRGGAADGGVGHGGSGNYGGEGNAAGEGGNGHEGPVIKCSCAIDRACVRVTVEREADASRQPWIVWPDRADGVGILRVSAVSDQYMIQDKTTVADASFVAADASYGAALCVPGGSTHVRAFLDDNEDAVANAVTSSDYIDSCSSGQAPCARCFDLNVSAGATTDLTIKLGHSCD
jgi:hypothetical protein